MLSLDHLHLRTSHNVPPPTRADRPDAKPHHLAADALAGRLKDLIGLNLCSTLDRDADIDVDRDKLKAQKAAPVTLPSAGIPFNSLN